jgi:rhodanese-related sulfurtransferase
MKDAMAKQFIFGMILCGVLFLALPAEETVPFTDITPAQAAALIKAKGADPLFVILDTRTAREFAEDRIKGATNIDVKAADFADRLAKLDKGSAYLVYCRGGVRSAKAMNLMKEWGFKEVYNLGGGLLKWQAEKLPLEGKPLEAAPPAK